MIYLDNAATTKISPVALNAMLPCFTDNYGNPSSMHTAGQKAAEALYLAREKVAACIGAEPREITFTSGGSEADNQAIITAANLGAKKGKKHIVSTAFEHHAVLHTLKKLEKSGYEVTYLDVRAPGAAEDKSGKLKNLDGEGIVTAQQVAAAIRPDTCLVTIMFANNEIGTVQPVEEIGRVCREKGVLFHTDAVQAAGHLPIDVKKQNIDMLSISAHKFGGPKGIGMLYARKGIILSTLIEGGAQERGKRAGTENLPAIAGMAAALEESCANMEKNAVRERALRDRLIAGLSQIPHGLLSGDRTNRLPGNVHFCFEGIEGESMLLLLDDKGICASSGSACTSGSLDPSHVLLAIGRPHEIAHGSLRLTLGPDNTEAEIDETIDAVRSVVERLRAMSPVWRDLVSGKRTFLTD